MKSISISPAKKWSFVPKSFHPYPSLRYPGFRRTTIDQLHIHISSRELDKGQIISHFVISLQIRGGKGVEQVHWIKGKTVTPSRDLPSQADLSPSRG